MLWHCLPKHRPSKATHSDYTPSENENTAKLSDGTMCVLPDMAYASDGQHHNDAQASIRASSMAMPSSPPNRHMLTTPDSVIPWSYPVMSPADVAPPITNAPSATVGPSAVVVPLSDVADKLEALLSSPAQLQTFLKDWSESRGIPFIDVSAPRA